VIHAALVDLEDRIRAALTPPVAEKLDTTSPPCASESETDPQSDDTSSADDQDCANWPFSENVQNQQNISTAPEMGFRCHIQPESNLDDSCNAQSASISPPK